MPRNHLLQGQALDVLHGEEHLALVTGTQVVDWNHAGVLELPLHPYLAHEAGVCLGALNHLGVHDLHRHLAPDQSVTT